MKAVEVRELVKDYGKFRTLKGISFEVSEEEVFGLIGANGAGKTSAWELLPLRQIADREHPKKTIALGKLVWGVRL